VPINFSFVDLISHFLIRFSRVKMDREGVAIIDFVTQAEARKACKLTGTELDGGTIRVELSSSHSKDDDTTVLLKKETPFKPTAGTTCFIGNLSWGTTEDTIAKTFACCGTVTGVHIVTDRESSRSKGFGRIDFAESSATHTAVIMSGTRVDGRRVCVDYWRSGDPRKHSSLF
jgi:RNA recognition motif-containing protein